MSKYDEHNVRADLSNAYKPIYTIVKKIETAAEQILREFDTDNIDRETLSIFISELSDLEQAYEELMSLLRGVLQDLVYESRVAKDIMNYLNGIKELFENLRMRLDDVQGFIKPGIDVKNNKIFSELLNSLNENIRKLREALAENMKEKIDILRKEQQNFEILLRGEDEVARDLA